MGTRQSWAREHSDSLLRLMTVLRAAVHRAPRLGLDWDHWRLSRLIYALYTMSKTSFYFRAGGPTASFRIEAILDTWQELESCLPEVDIDAFFDSPLMTHQGIIMVRDKAMLSRLIGRQLELNLWGDEDSAMPAFSILSS